MTPEQKKALATIQETDLGFGDNSAEQVDLQELQELAAESAVTGEIGSTVIELSETVKEQLTNLEQSLPVLIETYINDISPMAKKAARVAELITPGAEGNPTDINSPGYDRKLEEVGATLESLFIDTQDISTKCELAQISYFKNIIQRENNKLAAEIEFIWASYGKTELTQKEIKELKDRLDVIARLPEVQPGKLENQKESCIEEISRLVRACNLISRGE